MQEGKGHEAGAPL